MKKLLVPVLVLILLVSGCSSLKPSGDPKALRFEKGLITLGMNISDVSAVLGQGEEKAKGIYAYGSTAAPTTVMVLNEKVIFVLTQEPKATTDKGIKVGDKTKRIQKLYKDDAKLNEKNDGTQFYDVMYKMENDKINVVGQAPYDYYLGMSVENGKVNKLVMSDNTALKLPQ